MLELELFLFLTFLLAVLLILKIRKSKIQNLKFKNQLENFVSELETQELAELNSNYRIKESVSQSKVAIVSMVTKQPDFKFWLDYHLNHLKLDLIILRVEDSPEYEKLIQPYGDRVIASYHQKEDIDMKHNYLTIMDRQKANVNQGIEKARELGIDYIFHTDADELIYVAPDNQKTPTYQLLRKYLDEVPETYACLHMKNFEAVFPNLENKCFNTNRFIDCSRGKCLSYANGKSAGRVKKGIKFHGPHYFKGLNYNVSPDKLAVLHFDSCTYQQWENKFDLLKDTNEEKMKKIPFPFYKNSIRKLKKCGGQNKKEQNCQQELEEYYREQKVDSYHSKPTKEMVFQK